MLRRNLFRDNLRPGPENLQAGMEPLPNFPEIGSSLRRLPSHRAAIDRGTKPKTRPRALGAQEVPDLIGDESLRCRERTEPPPRIPRNPKRNIIEAESECFDAQPPDLVYFSPERPPMVRIGID